MSKADPRRSEFLAKFVEINEIFDSNEFALAGVCAAKLGCRQFDTDPIEFRHVIAEEKIVCARSPTVVPVLVSIRILVIPILL